MATASNKTNRLGVLFVDMNSDKCRNYINFWHTLREAFVRGNNEYKRIYKKDDDVADINLLKTKEVPRRIKINNKNIKVMRYNNDIVWIKPEITVEQKHPLSVYGSYYNVPDARFPYSSIIYYIKGALWMLLVYNRYFKMFNELYTNAKYNSTSPVGITGLRYPKINYTLYNSLRITEKTKHNDEYLINYSQRLTEDSRFFNHELYSHNYRKITIGNNRSFNLLSLNNVHNDLLYYTHGNFEENSYFTALGSETDMIKWKVPAGYGGNNYTYVKNADLVDSHTLRLLRKGTIGVHWDAFDHYNLGDMVIRFNVDLNDIKRYKRNIQGAYIVMSELNQLAANLTNNLLEFDHLNNFTYETSGVRLIE